MKKNMMNKLRQKKHKNKNANKGDKKNRGKKRKNDINKKKKVSRTRATRTSDKVNYTQPSITIITEKKQIIIMKST